MADTPARKGLLVPLLFVLAGTARPRRPRHLAIASSRLERSADRQDRGPQHRRAAAAASARVPGWGSSPKIMNICMFRRAAISTMPRKCWSSARRVRAISARISGLDAADLGLGGRGHRRSRLHPDRSRGQILPPAKRDRRRRNGDWADAVAAGPQFLHAADDPAHGLYFTRDPAAIAAHFGLTRAAPFVIDQDKIAIPGGWPEGGATVGNIPNNHMEYALTWFGGAIGLWIVFGTHLFRVWQERRAAKPQA